MQFCKGAKATSKPGQMKPKPSVSQYHQGYVGKHFLVRQLS